MFSFLRKSKVSPFNPKITAILRKDGWKEGRDEPLIEKEYQNIMGNAWLPEAAFFVRSFGNLEIAHKLWVYPQRAVLDLDKKNRIETVIGCKCCPVAASGYTGDGAGTLWIDTRGYFYYLDDEGMIFIGENIETSLKVLLLGEKPSLPPQEIRKAIQDAYEWNKAV